MILGLSLSSFTLPHVVPSLTALVTGGIVLLGMQCGFALPRVTTLLLATTLGVLAALRTSVDLLFADRRGRGMWLSHPL